MPMACNINLLVADKNGNAALIESFNGEKAVIKIDEGTKDQFICSTAALSSSGFKSADLRFISVRFAPVYLYPE